MRIIVNYHVSKNNKFQFSEVVARYSNRYMEKILPKKLEKGDTIGIVAPSEPVLEVADLDRSIRVLKGMGFKVRVGKNILKVYGGYMAGTGKQRADDIHQMFTDPSIRAIMCYTGGDTANRVLPYLDFKLIKQNPKIFIGFSDISTLTTAITTMTGLVTFHGPNAYFGPLLKAYTRDIFLRLLTEPKPLGLLPAKTPWKVLKKGEATGHLMGGNLTIVLNLIASKKLSLEKSLEAWEHAIFFWEEVDEEPKVIDRLLTHFKLAGIFDHIVGMVIGKLHNVTERETEYKKTSFTVDEIVKDLTSEYSFPIISSVDFGHLYSTMTLPIGVKARISTKPLQFEILEPAVSG